MLKPYAKEKNFNPYKVALVELGLEDDNFYRNEFLGNLESTESTTDKTHRLNIEELGAQELSELEQLIHRKVLQIKFDPNPCASKWKQIWKGRSTLQINYKFSTNINSAAKTTRK